MVLGKGNIQNAKKFAKKYVKTDDHLCHIEIAKNEDRTEEDKAKTKYRRGTDLDC